MSGIDLGTHATVAALAVSLIALVYSTIALLGQYLATADGYRRCQPSVMGPWAKLTRLRWRWTQFRFETIFVVPEIVITRRNGINNTPSTLRALKPVGVELVTGSAESRARTLTPASGKSFDSFETASWVSMLESIHAHESWLNKLGCYRALPDHERNPPAVRFRQRSWDFMPVDVIRPQALSTVTGIAILAQRLGMTWQDFRPHDGVLRAEGNGHVLISTFSKSVGIVLHYMHIGDPSPDNLYIQREEAEMLGFGILAGHPGLRMPTFKIGTIDEVYVTADILDPSRATSQKIKDVRGIEATCTFGFSDLIPMAAPMMRVRGSTIVRLPVPTQYCVGLTCHKVGFTVFYERLQLYIQERNGKVSTQTQWIQHQYATLRDSFPEWENEALALGQLNSRPLPFLEQVHTCWDATTDYFLALANPPNGKSSLHYPDLVSCHIRHAVNYWGDAWHNIRESKARGPEDPFGWVNEGAYCYWDYLPEIVADMRAAGFVGPDELVHEAWFSLMFRAFCWWRCHYMVEAWSEGGKMEPGVEISRLPSRFWRSEMPVYIG